MVSEAPFLILLLVIVITVSLSTNKCTKNADNKNINTAKSKRGGKRGGRGGRGGKPSFSGDAANDLDQANWVDKYFLDQDNRLG